jgi:hypothetical protein
MRFLLKEVQQIVFMTIANELSADVATAILLNKKGNRTELLKLIERIHLEFRRLSLEGHSAATQRHGSNVSKAVRQTTDSVLEKNFDA